MSAPSVAARPSQPRRLGVRTYHSRLLLPLVVAGILALWELAVIITQLNEIILPRPTSIVRALMDGFAAPVASRASYFPHIAQTLAEVTAGYAVGCTSGLVLAFQSMPKIALAPLIVVWFGFGFNSKFVLVILATFFPLFVNGITGFKSVEEGPINLMRSFGANRWQIFTKVTFPMAVPYIFAGLEIALVHAITSAIAAEFLGGQLGLGVMILHMEQLLDVAGIFSVLMILACLGGLLNAGLGLARRHIVSWAPGESRAIES